jgi:hypothetical protein
VPDPDVSLAAVLELLHGAEMPFACVAASYRIWRHNERASAAWEADVVDQKRRGAAISTIQVSTRSERPAEHEEALRVWRAGDRVREEREAGPRDGEYSVADGDAWWSWDETNGAMSNEDDHTLRRSVGDEVLVMLDPTPLLGSLKFAVEGRSEVAGRETISVSAVPRARDPRQHMRNLELSQLGTGADRYELEVDAERGVLLDAVALRDGEPFHRITATEISFDQPIGEKRFVFQPPPGEEVQSGRRRLRSVDLRVPDAQERAPFTVFIPDRIPPDWHVRCRFREASERPPLSASISLAYHSDDGHEGVHLSQYSATGKPSQYDLMAEVDRWKTVDRAGTAVRISADVSMGGQSQAFLELDGTFVFLSSDTLSADQLATIAGSLKPAPRTKSI